MTRYGLILSLAAGLGVLSITSVVTAVPADAAKKKMDVADEEGCYKKLGIQGRPHRLNTIASMSAIKLWSEAAKKHGENYALWHRAKNGTVKCEKKPRSDYYSCFASGKPCAAPDDTQSAKKN